MAKIKEYKGQAYTEIKFPLYRKVSDKNMYFIPSATGDYINVMQHDNGVCFLAVSPTMGPANLGNFITNSVEVSQSEFSFFADLIQQKIVQAYGK